MERQGLKVVLSQIKNPSKSPFAKGDFQISPFEKGALDVVSPKFAA